MKNKELIEELKKHDPELIVSTDGYEGGVTDTVFVSLVPVALNDNDEDSCFGEHSPNPSHYIAEKCGVADRLIIGSYKYED